MSGIKNVCRLAVLFEHHSVMLLIAAPSLTGTEFVEGIVVKLETFV